MKKIFQRKITLFKWQFNLFAFICISIGIVLGSYFGFTNIYKSLAVNDTVKTWTTNLANVANYTYDANLINVNSGNVTPGVNKLTNSSFDTDLAGWSGLKSYILNDEFSDSDTPSIVSQDDFARADGAIGGSWTGSTWSVSGNKAVNNPTVGSNLVTNSTYDSGTVGWVAYGTNTVENDNGTLKIAYVNDANGAYRYLTAGSGGLSSDPVVGTWYLAQYDVKVNEGSNVVFVFYDGAANRISTITSSQFATKTVTGRKLSGSGTSFYINNSGLGAGEITWWDNTTLAPLTLSSLFSTVSYSGSSDTTVQADVTLTTNTDAGIVMNLDNAANPQNFVLARHNGTRVYLEKVVDGVYTTLISATATYVDGATIKIVKNDNSYSLFYNGAQVGTTQTISDAGIISNTRYGLFSTYSGNSLDNFKLYNSINGTSANPTGGVRTVRDTENKMSIGSGLLTIAGRSTPVWCDPCLYYPVTSRSLGKVLVFDFTPATSNPINLIFGYDATASYNNPQVHAFYYNGGTLAQYDGGSGGQSIGSLTTGVNYKLAIVLKSTGAYYYAKGGAYTNWTLLWINTTRNTATLYPKISNSSVNGTYSFIRIPSTSFVPIPLVYDSFSRADGVIGNSETSGPDGQTTASSAWTGSTWSVSSNKAINNPSQGSDIMTNGGLEAPYSGGLANGWSLYGTPTVSEETSIVHGGTSSQKIVSAAGTEGIRQGPALVNGRWYTARGYVYSPTGGLVYFQHWDGGGMHQWYYNATVGAWTEMLVTFRSVGTGGYNRVLTGALNQTLYVDDVTITPMSLPELFSSVQASTKDVVVTTNVTMTSVSQSGLVLNLDSESNPQNFVIAYLSRDQNGTSATNVVLDKAVNGVYTNLINASVTYSAGAPLMVVKDGTKYSVYYNNTLLTSAQTISDAGIINNTKHGLFSTNAGNSLDDYTLFARGTSGEYNGIPADDLTATRDTGTKYSGAGSTKLIAGGNDANYTQSVNVGDTGTYNITGYAYIDGSAVTSSDLSLYYNGAVIPTTFTAAPTAGWYRLSGQFTGVASAKDAGVRVKAGKTVYVDDIKVYKEGTYSIFNTTAYTNNLVTTYDSFQEVATKPGSSTIKYQLCDNDGSTCESGNTWKYWNGSAWTTASNTTTHSNAASELTQSVMQQFPSLTKKISVKAIMTIDADNVPSLTSMAVGMTTDTTPPNNATDPLIHRTAADTCRDIDNCWTGLSNPKFTWTDGSDAQSGMKGYCLYLGTDIDGNPAESKGKLGTSPVSITDTPCQFIVTDPILDLAAHPDYLATALSNSDTFVTTANTYFLKIKAIDIAGNPSTDPVTIRFQYDGTRPTNVSYISTSAGNFSNVVDMSFSWPTSGTGVSVDNQSDILGWQYQINGTDSDGWKGTTHSDLWNIDYIPVGTSLYQLTQLRDGGSIVSGNNVVYFRTVDNVGNFSSDATVRTGNLSFGGEAPYFGGTDVVTVTPNSNTTNSYALSWPASTPTVGQNVTHYYYSINTPPASTLATLQSNASTFIDNGTSRTVSASALPNANKGSNTVYVVSVDDAGTPNYSPSNYITGTFTLDSSNPDNVGNLVASDSSIKSQSQWNVTLTWTVPTYQGAGNLTYQIYRSTDGSHFTQVGTSTGLSYVDRAPSSSEYYYKVYTKDGANALSSGTNAVSIIPTGRWTVPASLESDPMATSVTTRKATIAWSTDRTSDSKVAYGTKSGIYNAEEPSNSNQVTGHTITLSGLNPSTTYYYISKWTDEDGNTGVSDEGTFRTDPAPIIKNVSITNVGLSSAIVKFTSIGSSKVKVYYGKTTAFGGTQQIATSPVETTYTVQLIGLEDGTKYYFKLNKYDAEGMEYEGDTYNFTTLPRPKISNVVLQEIIGTSQTTILVTWNTNTAVSSIVSYYPEGKLEQARDEVVVNLTSGEHKMIIRGLMPQTNYYLTVKGRDKIGNEAESDSHKFTTSTDSRPPLISGVTIEGSTNSNSSQETTAQLIISWTTDEPSTSQVEYGEGTGTTYQQRSQLDSNLTLNHIVIISGLTPSKVYHLRVISNDKAGNRGNSIDTVTIAPKSTDNALDLVITNLQQIFGVFGK